MGKFWNSSLPLVLVFFSAFVLIFANSYFSFASTDASPNLISDSSQRHHFPYNGICAPGFVSLGEICVLNDRCGPGAYVGKICIMDGKIQPYLRPLHQGHAGISADNIICAEGKELVFKSRDATPACVNPESVEKLKTRGWQLEKPPMACTMEYVPVCGMDDKTYGNLCAMNAEHMILKHQGECSEKLISSFEECANAGFPVMESYPRQCRTDDGQHFVEVIEQIPEPESISTLYVGPELKECVGVAKQQCMLVREDTNSDWKFFYDQIKGFEFQEGFEYKLTVLKTTIENPPADASSIKYTLVEILEQNPEANP